MDNAIEFINWLEAVLSNPKVKTTPRQRSVIESVVVKLKFNLENQEGKVNLTDEEMSCFTVALTVFTVDKLS